MGSGKVTKKSLIMYSFKLVHFFVMIILFWGVWHHFYTFHNIPTQPLANTVIHGGPIFFDTTICVIYGVLLANFIVLYSAHQVGFYRISDLVYNQTIANLVALLLTYVIACAFYERLINPLMGIALAAIQLLFSIVWSKQANKLYFKLHKPKSTIVIYRNENDLRKLDEIDFFSSRWDVQKKIQWNVREHIYRSDELLQYDEEYNIDKDFSFLADQIKEYEVVFISGVNATLRNGLLKYCLSNGKACYFIPHTGDVVLAGAKHIHAFSVPIVQSKRANPDISVRFLKRTFDILISLIAIVILSPFMLVTVIAIKAYDRGPVLYKQVRLTRNGRRFKVLKFRSMRVDAEKDGVARLASEKDTRITPIGRVIRAIRFDELPQLFNILKGDMSIVGPRPERPEIAEQYMQTLPAFDLRLQVKAGLTGYAQVYGKYNTEPSDKLKMDLMYINNLGIVEDLKIMLATVKILFRKDSTVMLKTYINFVNALKTVKLKQLVAVHTP